MIAQRAVCRHQRQRSSARLCFGAGVRLDACLEEGLETFDKPGQGLFGIDDAVAEIASNVGDRLLNYELMGLEVVDHRSAKYYI